MAGSKRVRGAVVVALCAAIAIGATGCTGSGSTPASLPAQVDADFPGDVNTALEDALDKAVALSASSGGIAGVWAPWAGTWTAAAGTRTAGGSVPMSVDDRFRAGDITRGMTCTVLLKLVDEGRVKLDEHVSELLPSVPGTAGITLGQLCQSTSGLADSSASLGSQFSNNPERYFPPVEMVSNALANPRVGKPGESYSPSDAGYVLLGLALEAATHQSWDELFQDHIDDALGLTQTSMPSPDAVDLPDPHADGYLAPRAGDGTVACDATRNATKLAPSSWTSGAVVSTVGDLKKWAQALAAGSLLSGASKKAQWQTVGLGGDSPQWQGFGLGASVLGPLRGNSSAIPGYLTAAYSDPKTGLTVVVMLNNSTAGRGFVQAFAMELASIASRSPAASGETKPVMELPWSAEQMAEALQSGAICQPAG